MYGCFKLPTKTVLFVCYGNIARSVIAEGCLKKKFTELDFRIRVLSAGLNAQGLPPTKETLEVMKREKINIPDRFSKQLTRKLLEEADLILTMEERYKDAILFHYPQFKNKIFTLKEIAGEMEDLDIQDPYGQNVETYNKCAEEIRSNIDKSFRKIIDFLGVNR